MRVVQNPPSTGPERSRLLARIRREFATAEEIVRVGDRGAFSFTRVRDPDAVLDAVCKQEADRERGIEPRRPLRMPYWAAVWESGIAIVEELAARDRTEPLGAKVVLDLGCGLGMVGAAMALLGARVTLADIDTACLLFARLNTLPWAARCRVTRCDWQQDDLGERYDIIVGADVLYEVDQWPFIEGFLARHLKPDGVALIGEPGRPKAEVFPAWIEKCGWSIATQRRQAGAREVQIHTLSARDLSKVR